jgi:hypothetical protein
MNFDLDFKTLLNVLAIVFGAGVTVTLFKSRLDKIEVTLTEIKANIKLYIEMQITKIHEETDRKIEPIKNKINEHEIEIQRIKERIK